MSQTLATQLFGLGRLRLRRRQLAELSDEELVDRAGPRREAAAFAELVRRHESKVRGLLLRLTGNRTLADDLGQEAFLRAYRGLERFERRSRFSTWVYRIAYNVYLNHRTRTKTLGVLPQDYETRVAAPEAMESAGRSDLRRDLGAAIARLDERYRAVIVLYYIEDVSYPEIAEVLDLPLGTVKTHLHRARKMLRAELESAAEATV
ncbi:MAG: sigma-70 family RNA polymerase sigma factor [Myxococcales bacterium FL481]|nr:MAG: sigma-70 family RNA polymerase sigma factor [Myxococcales bacterium FL481]